MTDAAAVEPRPGSDDIPACQMTDLNGVAAAATPAVVTDETAAVSSSALQVESEAENMIPEASQPVRASISSLGEQSVPDAVEIWKLRWWLKKELSNEQACIKLPITLVLVVVFALIVGVHLQPARVHAVEHAIKWHIHEDANFAFVTDVKTQAVGALGHKALEDIGSIADWWSWLRIGLLPLMINEKHAYSENYPMGNNPLSQFKLPGALRPGPEAGTFLFFQKIVGGLRLRQERADVETCSIFKDGGENGPLAKWFGKGCRGQATGSSGVYNRYELELFPLDYGAMPDWMPRRTEWLLVTDGMEELFNRTIDMEDGCTGMASKHRACLCLSCDTPWFDEQTRRVEASFVTFNAEFGIYTLVVAAFFLNPGGHIHRDVSTQSVFSDPYSPVRDDFAWMVILDSIWALALLVIMCDEIYEICHLVWQGKIREYGSPLNMIDWFSITIGLALIVTWITLVNLTAGVNERLEAYVATTTVVGGAGDDLGLLQAFFVGIDELIARKQLFRNMLILQPIGTAMRLFKDFAAQRRLALVTDTLKQASVDLFHFALVLLSCVLLFAIAGVCLFGSKLREYSSVSKSFVSLFMLIYGEVDLDQLQQVGYLQAVCFFFCFTLFVVFVMFNMFLAIIMDSYADVKSKLGNCETLWAQSHSIWRRWRQKRRGLRMSLYDILKEVENDKIYDENGCAIFIKVRELKMRLPQLFDNQAMRMVSNPTKEWDADHESHVGMHQVQDDVCHVESRIKKLHKMLRKHVTQQGDVSPIDNTHSDPPMRNTPDLDASSASLDIIHEERGGKMSSKVSADERNTGSIAKPPSHLSPADVAEGIRRITADLAAVKASVRELTGVMREEIKCRDTEAKVPAGCVSLRCAG